MGATATAQQIQSPERERQERRVTRPLNPDGSVPEVRVAANVTTYLHFDAPVDRAAVEIEGRPARFTWVDVGDSLVALEPSVDLGADEKLVVRVRYRDGASPVRATLTLVTRPGVVDKEVEVVRHPRTPEALEAALVEAQSELAVLKTRCAVSGPAALVFSGRLEPDGVQGRLLEYRRSGGRGGLEVEGGESYRAGSWALAVVHVRNLPGQAPWKLGSVSLSLTNGTLVKVRFLSMDKAQIAPGEKGLVAVETEAPFWTAEEKLLLELVDPSGSRRLSVPGVKL